MVLYLTEFVKFNCHQAKISQEAFGIFPFNYLCNFLKLQFMQQFEQDILTFFLFNHLDY
jgi:hypothetical protein